MQPTKPAYVYVLRLRTGALYVGATANLRQRLAEHAAGVACRTTSRDPPVTLAYCEPCLTFSAARLREAQLKRWTRAKKEALIAGDAGRLRDLARRGDRHA